MKIGKSLGLHHHVPNIRTVSCPKLENWACRSAIRSISLDQLCVDEHDNLAEALSTPVNEWRDVVYNQFERSVFPNHPELAAIKEKMYEINGALYVSMTGSGSTVFGIFDRQPILWPFKELRTWVGKLR